MDQEQCTYKILKYFTVTILSWLGTATIGWLMALIPSYLVLPVTSAYLVFQQTNLNRLWPQWWFAEKQLNKCSWSALVENNDKAIIQASVLVSRIGVPLQSISETKTEINCLHGCFCSQYMHGQWPHEGLQHLHIDIGHFWQKNKLTVVESFSLYGLIDVYKDLGNFVSRAHGFVSNSQG